MKLIPYIKYILLIASFIAVVVGMVTYDSDAPRTVTAGLDFMFVFSFVLVCITILTAIVMPLVGIAQNPKSALRSLFGLAILVVVFFVSYLLSSTDPITLPSGAVLDSPGALIFSDIALYSMYIAFAATILSIVGSELYKIFK